MKLKQIFAILLIPVGLSGCDYLDFDESQGRTKEEAYSLFENVTAMVSSVYREVPSDWGAIGGALREAATDNAVYTWNNNAVWKMYTGAWSPLNTVDDRWGTYYNVIHDANSFLENYTEEYLERLEWNPEYEDDITRVRHYLKEVRVLRAFYHFELAKRFGDVPLLTRTYNLNEINTVEKTPFADVIKYVDKECSTLAPELVTSQTELPGNQTGHVTKGIALAIRSRALLYAASPLFAGEGDASTKWEAAAKAAYDVIAMNHYSLPLMKNDPFYDPEGGDKVLKSPQSIWEVRGTESNTFEARNLPIGFEGAQGGNTPTQNLVDEFDFLDGTEFDWNNPLHVDKMYYDRDGMPTRDPRLYLNVICDGMSYMGTKVAPLEGGKHGIPLEGATTTGYYLKKLMNETVSLSATAPKKMPHHYPVYRYAEILLNYAEAMNEWQGPEYTDDYCKMPALEALNKVRTAAGMQAYQKMDKDTFRKKVRKERRIELAFEDHRFWDIRRWMEGDGIKNIYGVELKNNTYKRKQVQTRVWEDKMYLYPIPVKETYVNKNLTQNPKW